MRKSIIVLGIVGLLLLSIFSVCVDSEAGLFDKLKNKSSTSSSGILSNFKNRFSSSSSSTGILSRLKNTHSSSAGLFSRVRFGSSSLGIMKR